MGTTLIRMTRQELASLDDTALCQRCVQPAALAMRGRGSDVREEVYGALTPGQRAVFMFWVLYAHGRGWTQMCAELPHLVGEDSFWLELKLAAKHLHLDELLAQTEAFEKHLREARAANRPVQGKAQDDALLAKTLARDLHTVASYIRANPGQFVELKD
ncbi:hypothetical protein [Corallococcus sp. 4LFB]|uniref:hypothetical protein n=1 Tax=Corallococcus sp. 4LFB TaxID=3383249 RepID=UPI0039770286